MLKGERHFYSQMPGDFRYYIASHPWTAKSSNLLRFFGGKNETFIAFLWQKPLGRSELCRWDQGPISFWLDWNQSCNWREDLSIVWFKGQTWKGVGPWPPWGGRSESIAKSSRTSCDRRRSYFLFRIRNEVINISVWQQGFGRGSNKHRAELKTQSWSFTPG